MIAVETDREIHSYHIVCDNEFIHHTIGVACPCNPENFSKTNVWHHQRMIRWDNDEPATYRTYKLHTDNTWDMVLPEDVPWFKEEKVAKKKK